jgi:hypothetical protein
MRFLVVAEFITLTPLSLLILCKLSFPIVGLNMFALPTLALKYPNKIIIWYLGNLSNIHSNSSYKLLHIIHVILYWDMNVQNDMKPVTSQYDV